MKKGGIVLGADTRATEGPIVADKNCEKIHFLAKNMYCCGAGTLHLHCSLVILLFPYSTLIFQ